MKDKFFFKTSSRQVDDTKDRLGNDLRYAAYGKVKKTARILDWDKIPDELQQYVTISFIKTHYDALWIYFDIKRDVVGNSPLVKSASYFCAAFQHL